MRENVALFRSSAESCPEPRAPVPSGPAKVAISIRSLCKAYGGAGTVVGPVDLDIAEGEFISLLGPSGSGKTTTLMMLAGFEEPSSGSIAIHGREVGLLPPHRRNLGIVFQDYALFPHMSVARNVAFPLERRRLGQAEIRQRVERATSMVRLDGLLERRPHQLSGGQKQRVALARALVFDPEVVLMDEPLGALDKQLREEMQREMRQIHAKLGTTFVYVTHDQSEALSMSNRIAVFDQGRIAQVGAPDTLYREPASLFVANFIGDNNNLSGQVEDCTAAGCTVRLDGGHVVRCRPAETFEAGRKVKVAVRPEQFLLARRQERGAVDGIVADCAFFGDHYQLRLAVNGQQPVRVKLSAAAMPQSRNPGDTVALTWPADEARAYADVAS